MSPCGLQTTVCELLVTRICYACTLQACPGSLQHASMSRLLALHKYGQGCVGCNTQHNVDNLTLRLVVACIVQGYVGSIPPKPEPNETPMIPGT